MTKAQERLAVYIFGVVFVVAILITAIVYPKPTPFQYTVFRIVLALACAGIAAFVPGFIEVAVSTIIKAGGAIAVFVIVFFWNPAPLFVEAPPISGTVLGPNEYPADSIIEVRPTKAELAAAPKVPPGDVTLSYKNATRDDLKLFVFDFSKQQTPTNSPFATNIFWQAWPFPADGNFRTYSQFRETTGWFAFVVGRFRSDKQSVEPFYLKTVNVLYSHQPTLTVSSTGNPMHPFDATFGERTVTK
jgi:hypothetical protein